MIIPVPKEKLDDDMLWGAAENCWRIKLDRHLGSHLVLH